MHTMTQRDFPISKAGKMLAAIIRDVEAGHPVRLTRLGRPVAALIPIREEDPEKTDFWEDLMSFRQIMVSEGVEISDSDFEGIRDTSPGREADIFS